MKSIYTVLNEKLYKINQDVSIPEHTTYRKPGSSSSLNIDQANKRVVQSILINTIETVDLKSNAQRYKEMVEFLKNKEITEVNTIQNYFKVCIEYTLFRNGKEIEHSQVIRPMSAEDNAMLLGVATNNECVYRRVKRFNPKINFKLMDTMPFGIMNQSCGSSVLKINNIAIFQCLNEFKEVHNSTYCVSYDIPSSVVNSSVEDSVLIYSTVNAGIDFQEMNLKFIPRIIEVSLDIILTNYVVAYNDTDINNIIIENIEKKHGCNCGKDDCTCKDPEAPGDGSGGGTLIPDKDNKEPADGDYKPDEDGYFSWYERCKKTTPNALKVVEDLTPDSIYDVKTMIKKSMVVKDIEDIEVDEYVIFRESVITSM